MKVIKKSKGTRGGFRPNAKRPPIYGTSMVRNTIRISEDQTEILRQVDPSLSRAVRAILDDPDCQAAIISLIEKRKAGQ